MSGFTYSFEVAPRRGDGEDRIWIEWTDDGLALALADGAGGTGHGGATAEAAVDAIASTRLAMWPSRLAGLEPTLRGQTTLIALALRGDRVRGLAVGDSAALIISGIAGDTVELTADQARKPLLGSGATLTPIDAAVPVGATLVVASDGLARYVRIADIARVAAGPDLAIATAQLIALARLPSGALQDDVAVILVRRLA